MKNKTQKVILLFSLFSFVAVSILITGCESCNPSQEAAWNKFLTHAEECNKDYVTCKLKCDMMQKQAIAKHNACLNTCWSIYTESVKNCKNIGCIGPKSDAFRSCRDACDATFEREMAAVEKCREECYNTFWACLNMPPKE